MTATVTRERLADIKVSVPVRREISANLQAVAEEHEVSLAAVGRLAFRRLLRDIQEGHNVWEDPAR